MADGADGGIRVLLRHTAIRAPLLVHLAPIITTITVGIVAVRTKSLNMENVAS